MQTFNYNKFIHDGVAETRDGEYKVIRRFIDKKGKIQATLKSLKNEAGLVHQNFNKEGQPINMYGNVYPNMFHINLVNE